MIKAISISEWQTLGPDDERLKGRFLDSSKTTKEVVMRLNESNRLSIAELRSGLEIKSYSHVGRLRIGDLEVIIRPKLPQLSMLRLLRYAFGFRRLRLFSDSEQSIDNYGFEDLLVCQLNAEVRELVSRGLRKAYIPQDERLASPRGRIDVQQVARDGGVITATLPCRHHPRIEDTLVNQVLLAGLHLAASIAGAIELRRESKKLAALLEEQVTRIKLDLSVIARLQRRMNRLTAAYVPAIRLIRFLVESKGISLEEGKPTTSLQGFLFDMNSFFQALIGRFLRENLPAYEVRDEFSLRKMMRFNPKYNPQGAKDPTPRPDFAIQQGGKVCWLLDAKYRDLWENKLPREMLYQLVVYAVSQSRNPKAAILYPTFNPAASESRIDVIDPIHGDTIGQVSLRPVDIVRLESVLLDLKGQSQAEKRTLATYFAFG